MSYYRLCPICQASLDPGERCDCELDARIDAQPELDDPTDPEDEERM